MGLKVKSLRNENDPLTFKIDDIDFNISFDNIEKEIKLDEKSLILLENAIFNDGKIVKNKKKIVMGDYTVKLNSSLEVNNLWLKAFDKLLEFNLIEKDGDGFRVTSKGKKYYENLWEVFSYKNVMICKINKLFVLISFSIIFCEVKIYGNFKGFKYL